MVGLMHRLRQGRSAVRLGCYRLLATVRTRSLFPLRAFALRFGRFPDTPWHKSSVPIFTHLQVATAAEQMSPFISAKPWKVLPLSVDDLPRFNCTLGQRTGCLRLASGSSTITDQWRPWLDEEQVALKTDGLFSRLEVLPISTAKVFPGTDEIASDSATALPCRTRHEDL